MDVICLGIFVVDMIGRPIDRFPDAGKLVVFDEFEMHSGGGANNAAITLAKLGINVGAMGRIGTDTFGDFVLQILDDNQVDTRAMMRDADTNTPATFVSVASDGERSFLHYMGTNRVLSEDDVDLDLIRSCKILHVAGSLIMPRLDGEPTARILRQAKEAGVLTSLDTVWDMSGNWLDTLEPCLPYVDVFLPSIEEAEQLTGLDSPPDIANFLMDYGIQTVGLKMGKRGSYVRTGTEEIHVPSYEVDVVDTTGAGDAYVAGFLAATVMGWDLKRTCQLASAAGAACVTEIGTTAGIKNLEETMAIIGA